MSALSEEKADEARRAALGIDAIGSLASGLRRNPRLTLALESLLTSLSVTS